MWDNRWEREGENFARCSSGRTVSLLYRRVGQGSVVTRRIKRHVIYGHTRARVYRSVISHITRNTHICSLSRRPSKSLTVPPTELPVCEDPGSVLTCTYGHTFTSTMLQTTDNTPGVSTYLCTILNS